MELLAGKTALRRVLLQVLRFPLPGIHTHLSLGAGTTGPSDAAVPSDTGWVTPPPLQHIT